MGEEKEAWPDGPGLDKNLERGQMILQQQCQGLSTLFSGYEHALAFTFLISKMKSLRQMIPKVISSLKLVCMFFQEILGMKQELRIPCLVLWI